ncbi:MAG: ABC transporter permease, partial [Candidatus Omnitrophica bacterium]|nr:ABC transporter permease [Candidatus Omnitrophota bacterium]
ISIIGVATGVAALIIVIGVMNGFDNELRQRIIGTSSHIVVEKIGGLDDVQYVMENLKGVKHVRALAPFLNTQALIVCDDKISSLILRGIDETLEPQVSDIGKFLKYGKLDLSQSNNIIIGQELAQRLMLHVGDEVKLLSSAKKKPEGYKVTGIFASGMYDYDSSVAFISLEKAKNLNFTAQIVSGVSVKLDDVLKANTVKKAIQERLGFPYYGRTWMDLNHNLFEALKLEKTAMFVILTLIVLVASLNIASTLIMMVMEKTKDIGILKAIGATASAIRAIFMMVGMSIGVIGTILGAAAGMILAYALKTYPFIKLPKDIYYIDTLPIKVDTADIVWIVLAALGISLFSTIYPAYQASRLNPVEALRYE